MSEERWPAAVAAAVVADGWPLAAFTAYVDDIGYEYASADWDGTVAEFPDAFEGEWESGEEFAQSLAEDTTPQASELFSTWPTSCIDWAHAWRELTFDGFWTADAGDGRVFVFRSV